MLYGTKKEIHNISASVRETEFTEENLLPDRLGSQTQLQ